MENFVAIPRYSGYEINKELVVRCRKTGEIAPVEYIGDKKIPYVRLKYGKKRLKVKLGELFASAFVTRGWQTTHIQCINGDWSDIRKDNFRWYSPRKEAEVIDKAEGREWRNIYGWYKSYEVSNDGRVRKYNTCAEIKPWIDRTGKLRVSLRSKKHQKTVSVSVDKLVARAFLEEKPLHFVVHKDGNITNNNSNNLEWSDCRSNFSKGTKRHSKAVVQYNSDGTKVAEFDSIAQAAYKTSALYKGINFCCKGLSLLSGGYVWRYKGDDFDKYGTPLYITPIEGEEYKEIKGSCGVEISNYGNIRSRRMGGKPLSIDKYGRVVITIDGKRTTRLVAKLVAKYFLPNPRSGSWVGYRDNNPNNRRWDNLYWIKKK